MYQIFKMINNKFLLLKENQNTIQVHNILKNNHINNQKKNLFHQQEMIKLIFNQLDLNKKIQDIHLLKNKKEEHIENKQIV